MICHPGSGIRHRTNWFGYNAPSAGIASEPSAVWGDFGRTLHVAVRGYDQRVYSMFYNANGWSGWFDEGGAVTGAPSVAAPENGTRSDIFAIGTDNGLFQRYLSMWFGLGGPPPGILGSPTATWKPNADFVNVYVTGKDNRLYQKFWSSAGWTPWVDLGGTLYSAPSAAWTSGGTRLDVFAIGADRRLWQKFWTTAGWTSWTGYDAPPPGVS